MWRIGLHQVISLFISNDLRVLGDGSQISRRPELRAKRSPTASVERVAGSMNFRARVRLAHQFISGSSVTACHNPACTIKASRWRVHIYCRRQLRQSYPRTRRRLPQPRRGRGNC
ncbi:MAG: hypothetical protein DLM68_01680 [Hyphomicrobiales bacterium]|nr:MAG: hypothetical protein DLM68_01680 [Hyphomicrobiales bacterium]